MSKVAAARRALEEGGSRELIRRTRLWLAAQIYPGTMPSPRRAPRSRAAKAQPPDPRQRSASSVDHAHALAWFEGRRPSYERLSEAVAPYVEPDGVVFDVGANIGFFTRVLAERTSFRGTAHLFEPVPNLARLCRTTLADAPYDVRVHEYGLSDVDEEIEIFIDARGNLGWNTIIAEVTNGMASENVCVRSFASTGIEDIPDLIKIDVEGAEYLVLRGMLDALATWPSRPAILCEIGWGTSHPNWEQELAVFADLEKLGYSAFDLQREPVDVARIEKTTDVLLLPS